MKKTAPVESKSLKTFYLYVFAVIIIIFISLVIKGILIVQESRFDSAHDFTIEVTEQKNIKEIISFHPQVPALSVLVIQDSNIPYVSLPKKYGITSDGYIQVKSNNDLGTDITTFLSSSILHTDMWQSNLTIFDKIRLLLLAKSVTTNNNTIEKISLEQEEPGTNTIITNALTDQDIADENISIQIINATDITGFGQRLGNVLTNMGANVVDVSTAQQTQQKTTIQYYGNKSYTLNRLQRLLGVTPTNITMQSIADIIITVGTDERNTATF